MYIVCPEKFHLYSAYKQVLYKNITADVSLATTNTILVETFPTSLQIKIQLTCETFKLVGFTFISDIKRILRNYVECMMNYSCIRIYTRR